MFPSGPPESSTYNGVNTSTDAAAAAGSSPGLPLSLPADPAPPAAPPGGNSSPDPGSLTVLQPANNNTATAAASPYSTMLPGFAHYSTGKFKKKTLHLPHPVYKDT